MAALALSRTRTAVFAVGALVSSLLAAFLPIAFAMGALLAVGATFLVFAPLTGAVSAMILIAPVRMYEIVPLLGIEVSATTVLITSLGLILVARHVVSRTVRLTRTEWLMVVWWAWMACGLAWSVNRAASIRGLLQWTLFFAATALTTRAISSSREPERGARSLLAAFQLLVVFWSIIGIVQMIAGRALVLEALAQPWSTALFPAGLLEQKFVLMNFNWIAGDRVQPFGPFINSISFGIFTAAGLVVAAAAITRTTGGMSRVPARVAFVLAATVNIATLKATGWVAAVVGLVMLNVALGGSVRRAIVGLTTSALLLGAGAYAFRGMIVQRLIGLAAREGVAAGTVNAVSRPIVWRHYVGVAESHLVTGTGLFTSGLFGPVHFTRLGTGAPTTDRLPTENGYLAVLIEQGLPGLTLLVLVLGGTCWRGIKLARRYPAEPMAALAGSAGVAIVTILVGNLTVNDFAEETASILLGVFVGIILVAARQLSEPSSSHPT